MLASSPHHKLQPLQGLLILVGILRVQHLGADTSHQHNLRACHELCYHCMLECLNDDCQQSIIIQLFLQLVLVLWKQA